MLYSVRMFKRASIGIVIGALLVGSLTGCGGSDTQVVSTGEPIASDPVPVDVVETQPNRIVFVNISDDGNENIFIMDEDGSNVVQLTNNDGINSHPAWSPDGEQIVFNSDRRGDHEIFVMNADGTGSRQLTTNLSDDFNPSWSPDGEQIVFTNELAGKYEIYTMAADGTGVGKETRNNNFDYVPDWSPDGEYIAFASDRDGNYDIFVMDADGSNVRQLTTDNSWDSFPAWSPDREQIAFHSDRTGNFEIFVMGADGSNVRQLTTSDGFDALHPAWSPDGKQIAFTKQNDSYAEIFVMDADGSNLKQITTGGGAVPDWAPNNDIAPIITAEPLPKPVRLIVVEKLIEAFNTSQIVADYLSSNQKYEFVRTTQRSKCGNSRYWDEIPALTSIYFRQGFEADAIQAMELLGTSSAEVKPWGSIPRDDLYNECWEPDNLSSSNYRPLPGSGRIEDIEADLLVFVGQDIFSVTPPEITAGYCGYWTERKDVSILHVNGTEIPSIDEIVERRFSEYNYLRSIDDDVPGYIIDTTVYYKEGCEIYATSVAGLVRADDNSPLDKEPFPDNPPFEIPPDADIVVYLGTESGGTLGNAPEYPDDDEVEKVCCSKFSPIWSPDGEHILFLEENEIRYDAERVAPPRLSKVFMVDADGSNISDCLYVCEPDGSQENGYPLWYWGDSIAFSQNGEYLIITTRRQVLRQVETPSFWVKWDDTPEDESSMDFANEVPRVEDSPRGGGVNCPLFTIGKPCGGDILIQNNKKNFGEDPSLDVIYNYCQKDDDYACIILNEFSNPGSEYQSFAQSCGGRDCEIVPFSKYLDGYERYGDSAYLDALYDACANTDAYACYELNTTAQFDSEYESFSQSCGGRDCDIFDKPIEPGRFILGHRVMPTIATTGYDSPILSSPYGNYFAGITREYVDDELDKELLFVMSLDGSAIYQPERPDNTFRESPIAFTSDGRLIFRRSVRNPNGEFGTQLRAEGVGIDMELYTLRYDNEDLIMDIDGLNQRPLTEAEKLQYQDGISPDGTKVVFTDFVNGRDEIFVMDADGTNRKQLTFSLN